MAIIACWLLSGMMLSVAFWISDYCVDPVQSLNNYREETNIIPKLYRNESTLNILLEGREEQRVYGRFRDKSFTYEFASNEVLNGRQVNLTVYYVDMGVNALFNTAFSILPDEYATSMREFEADYESHKNMTYYMGDLKLPHWFLSTTTTACFYGVESAKHNFVMTAVLALLVTLLVILVCRYRRVKKIFKVCMPIKQKISPNCKKYDVSRLRLRSKSALILSRPGVHFMPHKRHILFDKFKAYSIEGDGSSMACR
ncbi:uncharacterized protein LOC113233941 [Hyposmocoma kahamanoa]|uniref:uncharacterized protein LOC113233941 n=1 Tax=Hyposmocoma kahamanoa TaxID=1477025 RepID=UPI000E6D80BF|nr:uncharacterized protein LOC113233941 [Hyposmocoma kahamanoa]